MKKILIFCRLLNLLILLGSSSIIHAQVDFPKNVVLEYEFKLAAIPLGLVEKRLTYSEGLYKADSNIKPSVQAKLFFKGRINEKSTFKLVDNKLVSLDFQAIREFYKPYNRKVVFDHQNNTVNYNNGESEQLRQNTFDLGSFIFAFILEDLNAIENKIYQINTGKDYDSFIVLKPDKEKINTRLREFDTTKLTLKRLDRDNRFIYVWLDNITRYPVKIIKEKNGKKSTLILKSITR